MPWPQVDIMAEDLERELLVQKAILEKEVRQLEENIVIMKTLSTYIEKNELVK